MPGQTKTIDPGRAFGLLHYQGESMTFEQAKYKYSCYARDVLGLVGELEQPDPAKSSFWPMSHKKCPLWVLNDCNGRTIAKIEVHKEKA
jgi:hypothetical protein